MSEKEIRSYVATKDPLDKAGAYGIQGLCARYIREIKGDYNNVVGLPVGRLFQELKDWLHRKKAVIFDLDGTLLDTIQSLEYCGNRALEPFGYGPFPAQDYKYFVGDGAANLIKRALIKGGDKELVHFDEALKRYKDYFREDCMYKVEPYPGIPELIEQLKKEGIQTAVLSNKPHAETVRMIDAFFGKDCFDVVFGQRDGVAIKPSPDGVYQILEQLKLKPEQILYIGDTATDMKTGKGAGAFTIGALWGFRTREELEENKADAIIDNPLDLLNYL
ncbi:MAG: HAD-IA family hydrolase [Acetatifactor sp.]|nr:HAD-IA family hydrolase [Acetatifactor sp.]